MLIYVDFTIYTAIHFTQEKHQRFKDWKEKGINKDPYEYPIE